jgi:hypothetical protein
MMTLSPCTSTFHRSRGLEGSAQNLAFPVEEAVVAGAVESFFSPFQVTVQARWVQTREKALKVRLPRRRIPGPSILKKAEPPAEISLRVISTGAPAPAPGARNR